MDDYIYIYIYELTHQFEYLSMARETGVQSQAESYQRLKKWYLISPYLTLNIIRYVSRVKWSNPRKGVAPSLHLSVVAIGKGTFETPSTTVTNFTYVYRILFNPVNQE